MSHLSGNERGAIEFSLGPVWAAMRAEFVFAVLLAVANAVALMALTMPAWRDSARAGLATRRSELAHDALEPALARARLSYGKVLDAEQALQQLRNRVREQTGTVAEVATTLRAAVDAAGLAAERIRYQPQSVPELGLTQIQIELPVRGTYRQLRRLLEELLAGPSFLVLERIAVASDADEGDQLRVSLRSSVFLVAPSQAGADESDAVLGAAPANVADPVDLARQLSRRLATLPAIPVPTADLELDLSRLDSRRAMGTPVRRNPFAFVAAERAPRPEAAVAAPEIVLQPKPIAPVMPYELLGITRTDEALLATLSDGDHVHLLREGETLPEGYRVVAIDLVSVRLDAGSEIVRLSLRREDEIERESNLDAAPTRTKKTTKKARGSR